MSTEKKYIEWDLEKFKAGWPAEYYGKPARFIAHVPDADPAFMVVFMVDKRMWSSDNAGRGTRDVLQLLARELDPHPDNRDGLFRDQIGDGWRIKGHGETPKEGDEVWCAKGWVSRPPGHRNIPLDPSHTYRTRDPLPAEPMFKVGDRVVCKTYGKGNVAETNSGVLVRFDSAFVYRFYPDGRLDRMDAAPSITKLTTRIVNLGPEDIVLGKTVVRYKTDASRKWLLTQVVNEGVSVPGQRLEYWADLRENYEISFDHGVTWQKAEKEVEG